MTDAPPPATMVQMRPAGFKMVSFNDAPLLASRSAMYASYQHTRTRVIQTDTFHIIYTTQNHVLFYLCERVA